MEIINLNGEEYIKRSRVSKMEERIKELEQSEKALEKIKKIIGQSFSDIEPIIEVTETSKAKKRGAYNKDKQIFRVCDSAKMLWDIRHMDKDGHFFNKDNRKLKITLKHVLEVQKMLSKNTTNREVKDLRQKLGLDYQMMHRLIYNYQEHVFDKFIKEWNSFAQPKIAKKNLPVENNPEKRKEAGIYGI